MSARAPKSECFKYEASYGYCAAKDQCYDGFKGHIVINLEGVISGYTFAPANMDERDVLQDVSGTKTFIEAAKKKRKMLGGTLRQGGVIAAAGLVAVKTMVNRLAEDHAHATLLARKLNAIPGVSVLMHTVQTNIVRTNVAQLGVPAATVAAKLAEKNVLVLSPTTDALRWLTHRHVTAADVDEAAVAMAKVAEEFMR